MNETVDLSLTTDQIRALSSEQRIPYIRYLRVLYPRAEEILERIRYCIRVNSLSADPKGILLVGQMGVGKTTLLEIIVEENPRQLTATGTIIPAVLATIDAPATPSSLSARLLDSLGDPRSSNGTIRSRMMKAENFMRDCRTQLVLLDELQHVVDRDNKKVLQTVSDSIKNLIKLRHLACVLCGLQGEAEQVVYSNPQLVGIFGDPVVLEPFAWDTSRPATVQEFRTLLEKIESILPLRGSSKLYEEEMAWRIFVATSGLMRYIMRLIRESTLIALDRGQETLDSALLAEVFDHEMAKEIRGLQNPFVGGLPAFELYSSQRIA